MKQYEEKLRTKEEAIALIDPGEQIISTLMAGEAYLLKKQLEKHGRLKDNKLYQMLSVYDVIDVDPQKLQIISVFLGNDERKAFKKGKIDLLPNHFSDLPKLFNQFLDKKVAIGVVSPPDERGYFSLGTNCDYIAPAIKQADKVILEVNESMPRTYGENQIHISEVDVLVENHQPIPEANQLHVSKKDAKIGSFIAELIQDGDTIQIGFGTIPNAIMDQLKSHRRLSVHTEMIPEKIIELFESGTVTNENNIFKKGKLTATFAFGSRKLYDFLHENKDIYMLPVDQTNDVIRLAKLENFVTINATVEVDFLGQANSEMVGNTYWSSSGGQGEFQLASHLAKNSRGILCMHSTAKRDSVSKIVPVLQPGTPVTTSKNDIDYVVTEYGVAHLRGKAIRERTKELIRIAHPKFREELEFTAKKMGYLI